MTPVQEKFPNDESVAVRPLKSQCFILRLSLAIVFLATGIIQLSLPQQPLTRTVHDGLASYAGDLLSVRMLAYIFGTTQILFSAWLFSGKWIRFSGLIAALIGMSSIASLFLFRDTAWERFPLLLSADVGQLLIKDVLVFGVGFFMLFERRI